MSNKIQIAQDVKIYINDVEQSNCLTTIFRKDGFELVFACDESVGRQYQELEGKKINFRLEREGKVEQQYNDIQVSLVEVKYPAHSIITVRLCTGKCELSNHILDGLAYQLKNLVRQIEKR